MILLFQIIEVSTGVYSWRNLAVFAKKTVHCRRLWSIDMNSFSEELMESPLLSQPPTDLKNLVTLYNRVLLSLIGKPAPLNLRVHSIEPIPE